MLYLKADKLSQIQDVFNAGPLQDEQEISQYYQDATEARTGDAYSGFVEKMELLLEDSHHSYIHKLFIGHEDNGVVPPETQRGRKGLPYLYGKMRH